MTWDRHRSTAEQQAKMAQWGELLQAECGSRRWPWDYFEDVGTLELHNEVGMRFRADYADFDAKAP